MCKSIAEGGRRCLLHRTDLATHNARRRSNRALRAEIAAAAERAGVAAETVQMLRSSPPSTAKAWARETGHETALAEQCSSCGQFRGAEHRCAIEGLPSADYQGMPRDERVKAMLADLEQSVAAVVASGRLQAWLDAMATNGLGRWSFNNRMVALSQLAARGVDISQAHLMGFKQWKALDRSVQKGAKAVWILAPMTRRIREEDADGTVTESHRVTGFNAVPVFNVTDTEGKPLASAPVAPATGAATPGTVAGLRGRVADAGYSYLEEEIPGCNPATGEGTQGYTDPQTKRIVVDSRLSEAHKASVTAHELGHVHCGHVDGDYSEYKQHRGRMETEAEMTAYLVNRGRGMSRDQVDAFSPGYIAGWSRGDTVVIKGAMEIATKSFNKIMEGAWPDA